MLNLVTGIAGVAGFEDPKTKRLGVNMQKTLSRYHINSND